MDFVLYVMMLAAVVFLVIGLLGLCVRWTLAMFAPGTDLYRVFWYVSNAGCAASFLLVLLIFVLAVLGSFIGL